MTWEQAWEISIVGFCSFPRTMFFPSHCSSRLLPEPLYLSAPPPCWRTPPVSAFASTSSAQNFCSTRSRVGEQTAMAELLSMLPDLRMNSGQWDRMWAVDTWVPLLPQTPTCLAHCQAFHITDASVRRVLVCIIWKL